MRVRVAYAVDVNDDYRRAINLHYGKPGLASREDVRNWLRAQGDQGDDDLIHDLWAARGRGDEPQTTKGMRINA